MSSARFRKGCKWYRVSVERIFLNYREIPDGFAAEGEGLFCECKKVGPSDIHQLTSILHAVTSYLWAILTEGVYL